MKCSNTRKIVLVVFIFLNIVYSFGQNTMVVTLNFPCNNNIDDGLMKYFYPADSIDSLTYGAPAEAPELEELCLIINTGAEYESWFELQWINSINFIDTGIVIIDPPTIDFTNPFSLDQTSAVLSTDALYAYGAPIIQKGIVFSTEPYPDMSDNYTNDGSGIDAYTTTLTGLIPGTTYYCRGYAINSYDTVYNHGGCTSFEGYMFTTLPPIPDIISNPGNGVTYYGYTYPSIVLGNGQEWMSENLNTTHFSNGDEIPTLSTNNLNEWNFMYDPVWNNYNNAPEPILGYGKLYNHYAVSDPRNVCPVGWHVPDTAEFGQLIDYLGGGLIAGGSLKSTIQDWQIPNIGATNASGFSALPAGSRTNQMLSSGGGIFFQGLTYGTSWWSSTVNPNQPGPLDQNHFSAISFGVFHSNQGASFSSTRRDHGRSIRCIKD